MGKLRAVFITLSFNPLMIHAMVSLGGRQELWNP